MTTRWAPGRVWIVRQVDVPRGSRSRNWCSSQSSWNNGDDTGKTHIQERDLNIPVTKYRWLGVDIRVYFVYIAELQCGYMYTVLRSLLFLCTYLHFHKCERSPLIIPATVGRIAFWFLSNGTQFWVGLDFKYVKNFVSTLWHIGDWIFKISKVWMYDRTSNVISSTYSVVYYGVQERLK